jgi:Winged helix-turn-helix DNA-binding
MTAPAPQPMLLSLDQITLDERVWPRAGLDDERVELFAELVRDARDAAGTGQGWSDPLPPLVVVADGRGGYVLADGRHRYEARRRLGAGFDLVGVQVFQANGRSPVDFAYELGLLCTHGAKPLTTAEKCAAILRLLDERSDLSDRAIARLVGVSNSTVSSYRRALCDSHTGGEPEEAGGTERGQPSTRREPLRWEVAARRLAEDTAELLASCRKLFGGADFKSAGRELYDTLADLYGDEHALEMIDELSEVVSNARVRARKVAQVE